MNIKQMINEYLERTKIYKRKGTYDYYKKQSRSLNRAFDYLGYTDTNEFTKKTLTEMILYFKNHTKKKNSQINADMTFLSTLLNYNDLKPNLSRLEKLPDDTTNFRPLSDIVLDRLLSYLKTLDYNESNNLSWRLAIYLMLDTGVRMNELLNIKAENVDLVSNSIILETTKNGKKRLVFFNDLSMEAIQLVLAKKNDYLIWNYVKNERMNRNSIFYFMDKIDENIQTEGFKIHCHRLRKTFATKLLKMGCPITTIQKLLGHTDIKMTMIYLEIDNQMLEKHYTDFYPYKKPLL